jgi:hypothetical protein
MRQQNLLVVNHIISNLVAAVDEIRKQPNYGNLQILLITDKNNFKDRYLKYVNRDQIIFCNYDDPLDIKSKLDPYKDSIVGVICRGDKHVQYLRKLVAHLPPSVKISSAEALKTATNKQLMRAAFVKHSPEITPRFVEVKSPSLQAISLVEQTVNYPVIIKPANLFSSLLIQKCRNRSELESGLKSVFGQINEIYASRGIHEPVQVIAEEFLEGDFYSVDAYVANAGNVYFCPPVGYIPAEKLGIEDFFLYKRFIPTTLDQAEINSANQAVQKALVAINLTYSSAHVELVLTKDGWKIIEIGPRLGRFRHRLYALGYDINHSLNDVKIHLGFSPEIPTRLKNYCAAYSIYPVKEGVLKEISGLIHLRTKEELKQIKVYKEAGDECLYAKHGGGPITEFTIASPDKKTFGGLAGYIEENVHEIID